MNCDHTLTTPMCFMSSFQLRGKVYQLSGYLHHF